MNKQRVKLALWVAGLGLLPGTSALAEGFYFGISGGLATIDLPSKSEFDTVHVGALNEALGPGGFSDAVSSLDDNDEAWGVQVGYRWNSYVAAEVGYVNFGEALYELNFLVNDGATQSPGQMSTRYRSSGPTVSALGILPIGERFDIHGRAGVYFSDTRLRERADDLQTGEFGSSEFKSNERELFLGVGAAWNINDSYSLRLEYQRFLDVGDEDHTGESDIDLITLGILFR